MNQLPRDAILISANPNMVVVDDAVKHLASHEKLYWEVGFRIDKNRFSYPLFGFIHICGGQVEYRAMISDIVPFSRDQFKGALAEQVKPEPWRNEWDENLNNVQSHPWKYALVMTEIVPFSYDTYSFCKVDGNPVRLPPRGFVQVRLPSHLPGAPPVSTAKTGETNILEKNLEKIVREHPEEVEPGLVWERVATVSALVTVGFSFDDELEHMHMNPAGWRRPLFRGVCDFPKGPIGADGTIKAVTSDE